LSASSRTVHPQAAKIAAPSLSSGNSNWLFQLWRSLRDAMSTD
jgi:hypothetical protein